MIRGRTLLAMGAVGVFAAAASLVFLIPAAPSSAAPCTHCSAPPSRALPPPAPEEGHARQAPPQPGEWLDVVKEKGQTFEAYVAEAVNRVCPHRNVFYIQPLLSAPGRLDLGLHGQTQYPRALILMRDYAERFFGTPARLLEPIPMFEETLDPERDQYNADALLDRLSRRVPADAVAYIAITKEDLFSGRLNFVFGLGSLAARTGVYSLRRYQTADGELFLRRSLKLLAHEAGHIYSIEHCTAWSCLMQGANSLPEHDAHPLRLCPVDLRKLQWNAGFERAAWHRSLRDFYRQAGLQPEADWEEQRLR